MSLCTRQLDCAYLQLLTCLGIEGTAATNAFIACVGQVLHIQDTAASHTMVPVQQYSPGFEGLHFPNMASEHVCVCPKSSSSRMQPVSGTLCIQGSVPDTVTAGCSGCEEKHGSGLQVYSGVASESAFIGKESPGPMAYDQHCSGLGRQVSCITLSKSSCRLKDSASCTVLARLLKIDV